MISTALERTHWSGGIPATSPLPIAAIDSPVAPLVVAPLAIHERAHCSGGIPATSAPPPIATVDSLAARSTTSPPVVAPSVIHDTTLSRGGASVLVANAHPPNLDIPSLITSSLLPDSRLHDGQPVLRTLSPNISTSTLAISRHAIHNPSLPDMDSRQCINPSVADISPLLITAAPLVTSVDHLPVARRDSILPMASQPQVALLTTTGTSSLAGGANRIIPSMAMGGDTRPIIAVPPQSATSCDGVTLATGPTTNLLTITNPPSVSSIKREVVDTTKPQIRKRPRHFSNNDMSLYYPSSDEDGVHCRRSRQKNISTHYPYDSSIPFNHPSSSPYHGPLSQCLLSTNDSSSESEDYTTYAKRIGDM